MSQGMFSAVTGIAANQTKLDVIADNIANLNTVAFKSTQVNFETVFSRTISTGQAPVGNLGGTNPKQIGLGVQVADMTKDFNQGNVQSTGKAADLNIQGEGFFVLDNGSAAAGISGSLLTRAGNFTRDKDGVLVNPNGLKVMGTNAVSGPTTPTGAPPTTQNVIIPQTLNILEGAASVDINAAGSAVGTDVTLTSFSVSSDGAVNATYSNGGRLTVRTNAAGTDRILEYNTNGGATYYEGAGINAPITGIEAANLQIQFATVANAGGLVVSGGNLFSTGVNSGNPSYSIGAANGVGNIESGSLETSNVDLTREFSQMMISQRALEANSRSFDAHNSVLQTIVNLAR